MEAKQIARMTISVYTVGGANWDVGRGLDCSWGGNRGGGGETKLDFRHLSYTNNTIALFIREDRKKSARVVVVGKGERGVTHKQTQNRRLHF